MKHVILAAALALAACTAGARTPPPAAAPLHGRGDLWPERGVVVADTLAPALLLQCSRGAPDPAAVRGVWHPSPAEIRALEAGLAPILRDALSRVRPYGARWAANLSAYYRQYGGIDLAGERVIYVSGFVGFGGGKGDTLAWRQTPLVVCDGGYGVFGVEYAPATGRFRNLRFNGFG